MALFRYGRNEQRLPQEFGGLVLMIGPYFSGGALVWGATRLGW